ncbi:MAG: alpha-D-ribose 1-methylphosphonate 5-triphosphate diphosphatase [Thalassobaculaceae bacterium]|nr:alpha-D-ribose 1-methylphosphonate 5-triphosphate diphosphatase [Thalassobaculaceae bacterium]
MKRGIASRRVLLADGTVADTVVTVEDGTITAIGAEKSGDVWDAGEAWVLPGVIDLHGDAFERQIMPRPGVHFAMDLALQDTDAQLLSNGITTAYHGVTYSWEPGLRGRESTLELKAAIEAARPRLGCDTRFHLRHETHNLAAEAEVLGWLADGTVDLLAFNDHSHVSLKEIEQNGKSTATYVGRTGLSHDQFMDLLRDVCSRQPDVPASIERLSKAAIELGVALASHDDYEPDTRTWFHGLGCRIAEFPMNTPTAETAVALGDPVICGAPNILRGGSHLGTRGLTAATEVRDGRCTILVSDYYYPALAQAPFRLVRDGDCDFPTAWGLISTNPAKAAGLDDRGTIETGKRADIVVVAETPGAPAKTLATLVAGRDTYRTAA